MNGQLKGSSDVLLMIDNYDSFTYNLVQYLRELGAEVVVYRNDRISIAEIYQLGPRQIVISPGPCTPKEAGISVEVVKRFAGTVPILGVCLGHQAIGQAFGGAIVRAELLMHGKTSRVYHDGTDIFTDIANPFEATRYHSLVIEKDSPPDCLRVTAWTEEGEIMGVSHREFPIWGVQFHPESILTVAGKNILRNFLKISSCREEGGI